MTDQIDLSIIIPVFNGEFFLKDSLAELGLFIESDANKIELIFVDDCSTDKTLSIINFFAEKRQSCQIIHLAKNAGKGFAIKEGIKRAGGDYICFTDADLPYGLNIFLKMLAYMRKNQEISLLYGSRNHEESVFKQNYGLVRRFGRLFFSCLVSFLAIPEVSDTQCGIKMMTSKLASLIIEKSCICRFAFDVELFVISKINGFVYQSFPVELRRQNGSSVRIILDTLVMIENILKIRKNAQKGIYTISDSYVRD